MQLSQGECAILAYFPSVEGARRAKEELQSAGFDNVQLDRVSRYGVNYNAEINNPVAGRAETITGLVLYSAGTDSFIDNDTRVLRAADPSVSGYGNAGYGVAGGSAYLVTVVAAEKNTGRVEEIVKKHGGKI